MMSFSTSNTPRAAKAPIALLHTPPRNAPCASEGDPAAASFHCDPARIGQGFPQKRLAVLSLTIVCSLTSVFIAAPFPRFVTRPDLRGSFHLLRLPRHDSRQRIGSVFPDRQDRRAPRVHVFRQQSLATSWSDSSLPGAASQTMPTSPPPKRRSVY
jgi:hypothetical protein